MPAARYLQHDRLHFPGSPFGIDESGSPAESSLIADRPPSAYVGWEHHTEHIAPPASVARRLGTGTPAELVTATRYLMSADGQPVQLATSYEPAGLTGGTPVALPEQGPYAGRGVVERMRVIGIEVDQVLEELSVRTCLLSEAAALALPAGSGVVVIERTHFSGGQPVETADIVISADRYRIRYRFAAAGPAA